MERCQYNLFIHYIGVAPENHFAQVSKNAEPTLGVTRGVAVIRLYSFTTKKIEIIFSSSGKLCAN
jgi:hypothetical protein